MKRVRDPLAPLKKPAPFWRQVGLDTLLALGSVTLATTCIAATHLYPRIPTISLAYLLVVLALASFRGRYAAVLAALLAFFSYLYFLVPPLYTFIIPRVEDLFTLVIFLVTAIITSQLASSLRLSARQARENARELRVLYQQAQKLAALQERQLLARELHDSVSQVLYGIGLGSHAAREALINGETEQATSSLDYVIGLSEAGMAEMRALIFELRPESLENEGLVAALTKQVAVLRTRHKLQVEVELDTEPDLGLEQKHNLYRIAQEALHNVVRHARASAVILRLSQESGTLTLEVDDNGRGFEPGNSFPSHLGLRSMRERAARMGATLAIESSPGQGCHLYVQLPTREAEG